MRRGVWYTPARPVTRRVHARPERKSAATQDRGKPVAGGLQARQVGAEARVGAQVPVRIATEVRGSRRGGKQRRKLRAIWWTCRR
jgi:hypothetical protein